MCRQRAESDLVENEGDATLPIAVEKGFTAISIAIDNAIILVDRVDQAARSDRRTEWRGDAGSIEQAVFEVLQVEPCEAQPVQITTGKL